MEAHHGTISQLTKNESLNFLTAETFGHLGCCENNHPYVVPIIYAVENGFIYCHTRNGKKLEIMRKNHHVCLQVEKVKDFLNWKSIMINGEFEELQGDEAQEALRLIELKLDSYLGEEKLNSLETYFNVAFEKATAFKIKIKNLSGLYEGKKF